MQTSPESSGIDKQGLWGWWHEHQKWADRLHRKAAHKALDIEDDEMIQANRIYNGLDWMGIVAVGLLAAATGVCGFLLSQNLTQNQVQAPNTSTRPEPADADYEIRFYDAQGNPIRLDRWPGARSSQEEK